MSEARSGKAYGIILSSEIDHGEGSFYNTTVKFMDQHGRSHTFVSASLEKYEINTSEVVRYDLNNPQKAEIERVVKKHQDLITLSIICTVGFLLFLLMVNLALRFR